MSLIDVTEYVLFKVGNKAVEGGRGITYNDKHIIVISITIIINLGETDTTGRSDALLPFNG